MLQFPMSQLSEAVTRQPRLAYNLVKDCESQIDEDSNSITQVSQPRTAENLHVTPKSRSEINSIEFVGIIRLVTLSMGYEHGNSMTLATSFLKRARIFSSGQFSPARKNSNHRRISCNRPMQHPKKNCSLLRQSLHQRNAVPHDP